MRYPLFIVLLFLIAASGCRIQRPLAAQELHDFFRQSPIVSAHRGGMHFPGYPENCIETFDFLLSQIPAVIEFDVSMTADSVLILLHDNTLDRTTTGTGRVAAHEWTALQSLFLKTNDGLLTQYRIPTFEQALQWTKAKNAVLTVDVKRGVPFEKVVYLIEKYQLENRAAVITYNAADALAVHRLNPRLIISATIRNAEELERITAAGIPAKNLLAFTGTSEASPELYAKLKEMGIPAILGTMGNLDNSAIARGNHIYSGFIERGVGIIATDRPVEAYRAIKEGK
jgi:glycerophosphoryl diester phosphodiesterase